MPYLTYEEYNDFGFSEIAEDEFNKNIKKASAILDSITSFFYVKNAIEKDNTWRVKQFKQALCAQIEYFHEVGSTTSEGINSAPQSFTAGRTSVSNASSYKVTGQNEMKSLVPEDVFVYLEGTGLLYSAISVL